MNGVSNATGSITEDHKLTDAVAASCHLLPCDPCRPLVVRVVDLWHTHTHTSSSLVSNSREQKRILAFAYHGTEEVASFHPAASSLVAEVRGEGTSLQASLQACHLACHPLVVEVTSQQQAQHGAIHQLHTQSQVKSYQTLPHVSSVAL